jgi:hypothetical protein
MWSAGCPSLVIEPQKSVETSVAVACAGISLLVPWLLPYDLISSLTLCGAFLAAIALSMRRAGGLGSRGRVIRAAWDADGQWRLSLSGRETVTATLTADTRVTPYLIWLHWRTPVGPRQMLLVRWKFTRGSDQNGWRQLIVRLRFQRTSSPRLAGSGSATDPASA